MTARRQLLTFPGTVAGLAEAGAQLRDFLTGVELLGAGRYHIELIFDEIAGNIIRHGRPAGDILVTVELHGSEVVLTFDDDGPSFDPRSHTPRAIGGDLEHAPDGGLGLVLVRTFASRFEYEQTPEHHNRLTVAVPIA
jgi:anti-sigma regulatory factor (Ser/Thr protein kinase)